MEFLPFILAFFIFIAIPYIVLLTLATVWSVAKKIKNVIVKIVKTVAHPIN